MPDRKFDPISCSVLLFFISHTRELNQAVLAWTDLFRSSVSILPVLSPSFPPSTHINNRGIGDRALFCHLTFPPQTQQQTARDASWEQITAGLQYKWRKAEWLPVRSWIQLFSQASIMRRGTIFTQLHHLLESCDGFFMWRRGFTIAEASVRTLAFFYLS